jgi:hypothetical protein
MGAVNALRQRQYRLDREGLLREELVSHTSAKLIIKATEPQNKNDLFSSPAVVAGSLLALDSTCIAMRRLFST